MHGPAWRLAPSEWTNHRREPRKWTRKRLAVVPGLAWTEVGDRLGQGGGFYDRLLPQLDAPAFGVGFDVQVVESLPLEAHDASVDRVWWADHITQT